MKKWPPLVAKNGAYLIGLINILSVLFHGLDEKLIRFRGVIPGALPVASGLSVVSGVVLILLAQGLGRRKRRAWILAIALLAVSATAHIFKGPDYVESAISILALVILLIERDEFQARSDPRTRLRAFAVFAQIVSASLVIGFFLHLLRANVMVGDPSLMEIFKSVVANLFWQPGSIDYRSDRMSDLVTVTIGLLGILALLLPTWLFLKPQDESPTLTDEDEARMRELIAKFGSEDSLAYFALRRDKSVVWSPTGKSAITYRVVNGVMLASGDPLGDAEAWPGAIREFVRTADRHAWIPAVLGCSERAGEVWAREVDLNAMEIGDEAIVDVAAFTLEGRAMKNVRNMMTRIQKLGYSVEVNRLHELSVEQVAQYRGLAQQWRHGASERGFSMALGRFGSSRDGECVVVRALKNGEVVGLLNFVPWGSQSLSLDLMRRSPEADPGVNELMIASLLIQGKDLGLKEVSLNFAALRWVFDRGERLGAGPIVRSLRTLLTFLSRWVQIESLYRFNAKFRPIWEPRYLIFPKSSDLPRIGLAIAEAEAFLVWPSFGRWFGRSKPELEAA